MNSIEALRIARDKAREAYAEYPSSHYLALDFDKKQKALDKALFMQLKQPKQTTVAGTKLLSTQQKMF